MDNLTTYFLYVGKKKEENQRDLYTTDEVVEPHGNEVVLVVRLSTRRTASLHDVRPRPPKGTKNGFTRIFKNGGRTSEVRQPPSRNRQHPVTTVMAESLTPTR